MQVSKICKTFWSGLSSSKKFSKTQFSKIVQLRGILMPGEFRYVTFLPNKVFNSFLKEGGNMDLRKIINEESLKKVLVVFLEI